MGAPFHRNSPLLHSVSYAGLWGQAFSSVDDFVDKAADLGYAGVMLMAKRPHVSPLDFGARERAALRSRLEKRGLRHVCIAGYTNFTADMEHGEVPQREMQVWYVTELTRLTSDLGGDLVRIFTGYESPAAAYSAQWKLVAESLRECARRASDYGVVIGVQNHHDIAAGYESLHDLIGQIGEPNCKAMFDAWAPALQGVNIAAAAAKLAPLTVHTTVADYQLRPRYRYEPALVNYRTETPAVVAVPMGEGFIDYPAFMAALGANGFDGTIAYEMCSPLVDGGTLETLDTYARRFLEWLENQRGRATSAD
jgi:sugar phosphate isomerase/epimerase